MYHFFLIALAGVICYKFGDWRNWKVYYPTILFFILSSLACIVLTYNHPLWLYESKILNHTFCDLLISITVYPCTILTFIPYLPRKITRIIPYVSIYVGAYTISELISVKLGCFTYYNGWNIWSTLIFNYIMFLMLILHHKKPICAWLIALVSPHILFFIMKIPYSTIR